MQWGFNHIKLILKGKPLQLFGFYDAGGLIPPPPPYIIAATNTTILNSITGLDYTEGSGPSNPSQQFKIQAAGLTPSAGNITITPSTDFEVFDGTTWQSSPFTIPYTSGTVNTAMVYQVRLKAGLAHNSYSENVVLSGANAANFNILCSGTVSAQVFITATGGTITTDGNFKVHTFTGDGIFQILSGSGSVQRFRVAGGGGGWGNLQRAGGAGGGGVLEDTVTMTVGSFPVTIGAGGAVENDPLNHGNNGSDTTFDNMSAIGGGHAGKTNESGGDGGCGGGAGNGGLPHSGGTGTVGQGFNGGDNDLTNNCTGGGGGAGVAGSNGNFIFGGNGGNGIQSSITGTATYYAGGAGGSAAGPAGTSGLGGAGQSESGTGGGVTDGAPNTGGGGGSVYDGTTGGSGGSGVFICRYQFQ